MELIRNIMTLIPEPAKRAIKPIYYKIKKIPQKARVELNFSVSNYTNHVRKQIESNNPWYTGAQFAWAKKESIRRIYDQRFLFL